MSPDFPPPADDLDLLAGEELADLLNTALDKGVILHGDVTIAVADVDLIKLNLGLLVSALATIEQRPAINRPTLASVFGPPNLEVPPAVQTTNQPDIQAPLNVVAHGLPDRINADAAGPESGLARLVLTLIEVLRKVLEHQAVRRMDGGKLTPAEIERLGLALSQLHNRMEDLKRVFGLSDQDLQIDLGPLGRLR